MGTQAGNPATSGPGASGGTSRTTRVHTDEKIEDAIWGKEDKGGWIKRTFH